MTSFVLILQFLLPVAYGWLVAYLAKTFFRAGDTARRMRTVLPLAYSVLALHAIYIGAYTVNFHHCLLATIFELCSLIAFTLYAVYTFAELKPSQEASGTGFFVVLVAFVLQMVSSVTMIGETLQESKAILKDPVFNLHVTSSVFGYAALMLASIYGALYLLLFHSMRRNEYGALFQHIPNLERLERFGLRATAFGFVFLTIAIVFGALLIERYPPTASQPSMLLDPKIVFTVLVWLIFGLTLLVRKVTNLEGRKLVIFWMSGFALTLISMTIINAFGTSFHSFL